MSLRYTRSELLRILGALSALIFIGAFVYAILEGWSALDALYATVITITTVGYGDLSPQTVEGRAFAIIFTLLAITLGGYSISTLAAYTVESRNRKIINRFRKRNMNRIQSYQNHYILCGADLLGTRIAEEFYINKVDYVIIDSDAALVKSTLLYSHPDYFKKKLRTLTDFDEIDLSEYEDLELPEISEMLNVPYLLADPTDDAVLLQAGIERASGLIAACPDDRDNISIIIGARNLANRAGNDALRIMTRATEPKNMRKMYLAGANFVRIPTIMSGMEMAVHMLHPEIGNWWYSHVGQEKERSSMFKQINLSDQPDWVGKAVGSIYQSEQTIIVSVKRDETFVSPPPFNFVLKSNDIAIVLA